MVPLEWNFNFLISIALELPSDCDDDWLSFMDGLRELNERVIIRILQIFSTVSHTAVCTIWLHLVRKLTPSPT
jgi:hypothetical protein